MIKSRYCKLFLFFSAMIIIMFACFYKVKIMSNGTGQVFIVAAPSGGGKTSLVQHLVKTVSQILVSISHNTRDRRPGEVEGEHYFYVSESTFLTMIQAGEFVEYANVYGHHYGTSVAQIDRRLSQDIDVVLDIDWQGAQQIRHRYPHAVSIFILPPSLDVLRQRLADRQRDKPEVIEQRMEKAHTEIQHFCEFDYLIINDDFATAADALRSIVVSARLKETIQSRRHQALLSFLVTGE
jgi:guanylate kinase